MISVGTASAHAQSAGPQRPHPQTHSAAYPYARHQRQLSTPSAFGPSYALMSAAATAAATTPSHMQHQRHQSVDGGAAGPLYGAFAASGQPAFLQPQPFIGSAPFDHVLNALTGTPPMARAINVQQAAVDHGRTFHFPATAAPLCPQGINLAHIFPRPPVAGSQLGPAHSIPAVPMEVPGGYPAAHQEQEVLHQMVPSTPTRQCRQGYGLATPRRTPGTMTPSRGPGVGARSVNLLTEQLPVVLAPMTQTPRGASPCRVSKKSSPQKRTGSPSKKRPAGRPALPASLLRDIADKVAADGTPIPNLATTSETAGVGLPTAAHAAPLSISPPKMGVLSTPQASSVSTPSMRRSDDPFVVSSPGAVAAAPPQPILPSLGGSSFKDPFLQGTGMLRTPQASVQSSPVSRPFRLAPSLIVEASPKRARQPVPKEGGAIAQPDGPQTAAATTTAAAAAANPAEAKSPAVLDLEAARVSTGFTLQHVDSYIEGPDAEGNFRCLFQGCQHVVGRQENARCHVQTHIGDRQFVCTVCNKDFVRKNDLKRHFVIHAEQKPHPCACGKTFSRLDALNRHRSRNLCIGGERGIVAKEVKRGRKPKRAQNVSEDEQQQNAQHASQPGVAMSATSSSSGLSGASSQSSPQETVSGESQGQLASFYSPAVSPVDEPGAQSAAEQVVEETATAQSHVAGISAHPRRSDEHSNGSSSHAPTDAHATQRANPEISDDMSPTFDDEIDTQIPMPAGLAEFLGPTLGEISAARGEFEGLPGAGFDASAVCAELDRELLSDLRSTEYSNAPARIESETWAAAGVDAVAQLTGVEMDGFDGHPRRFFAVTNNFASEQSVQPNPQTRRPTSVSSSSFSSSFSSSSSSTYSSSSSASSNSEQVDAAAAPQVGSVAINNDVNMDDFFDDDPSLYGSPADLSPSATVRPSSQTSPPSPAPQASSAAQPQSTSRQVTPEEEMAEKDFDEMLKLQLGSR